MGRHDPRGAARRVAITILSLVWVVSCAPEGSSPEAAPDRGPSRPIVTLAPHLTELVFAAGAGERIGGTVDFSDYPPAARSIPRVGDAFRLDYEAITALRPELILAWRGGNPDQVIQRLRDLGFNVLALDAAGLESVSNNLRRIGEALGATAAAHAVADEYDRELAELRREHVDLTRLRVFYQVSREPLFTISEQHVIDQAIELCGGLNVFADLEGLSPSVSLEAVLDAAPEVIIASNFGAGRGGDAVGLDAWKNWKDLPAVVYDNLFFVDADHMVRPGIRIVEGVRQMCDRLDRARRNIASAT